MLSPANEPIQGEKLPIVSQTSQAQVNRMAQLAMPTGGRCVQANLY